MIYHKFFNLLIVTFIATVSASCSKKITNNLDNNLCLNNKLLELRQQGCPSRDSLKQFTFQNKTVYLYQTGSCGADFTSPVIDENCKEIGFLGGFGGNTTINGEDFSNAIFIKTIWNN